MTASPFLMANWPAPANIRALTTLRYGLGGSLPPFDTFNMGNRYAADGDLPETVAANRAVLTQALGLSKSPLWLKQVHGIQVIDADDADLSIEHEADAAIAGSSDVVLAVLHADCLPVLLCSRNGSYIGAAHAGWRGLAAGIIEAAVAAMPVRPDQLMAWLGPCAGPKRYEIDNPVRNAFISVDQAAQAAFVETRPGHWLIDLYALARLRLKKIGVDAIYSGDECTMSSPYRFFSHRRDQRTGRMASLIWRCN